MLLGCVSKKGLLAIKQPEFSKIEQKLEGGLSRIAQRTDLIYAELLMGADVDGQSLRPSKEERVYVILKGVAGLNPWAKQVYILDGVEFVLCPENDVVGYVKRPATLGKMPA